MTNKEESHMETSDICKFLSRAVLVLGSIGCLVTGVSIGSESRSGILGFGVVVGLFLSVAISAALIYAVGEILDKLAEISDGIKSLNETTDKLNTSILEPQKPIEKPVLPVPDRATAPTQGSTPINYDGLDKSRIIEDINRFENATDLNNYVIEVMNHNPDLFNDEIQAELAKSLRIAKMYGNAGGVESYRKKILDYLNQQ